MGRLSEEEIPQEFTREQFLEHGLDVTEGEVRAVNHHVFEMERAFREQKPGEVGSVYVVDDVGEDYDDERMAMLIDYARNFLREEV
jgi:hypothetical protein